jgi:hypothetical protein
MSSTDHGARRLEALTPEQEALLARVRDEWLRIGLATGPADQPAAEEGVRQAYQAAGLPSPARMVWVDSPLAGAIAISMLCALDLSDHVPDLYWRAVRERLRRDLEASVWVQPSLGLSPAGQGRAADRFGTPIGRGVQWRVVEPVRCAVLSEVHDRLGRSASASLRRVVEGPVATRVSGQLTGQLLDLVRQTMEPVEPVLWPFLVDPQGFDGDVDDDGLDDDRDWALPDPLRGARGQHDADWLARAAGLRAIVPGVLDHRGLDALMLVARSAGWWWPFEHLAILTERPTAVRQDAQGRLHHADGPAIAYPDGFAIWAWHGVSVPRQVIERPEQLTVQQIRDEPRVAVRQVMLERYGSERYLRNAAAERVSHDDVGTLWSAPLGAEGLVVVEVRNSTPEPDGRYTTYWLRVPPEVRTAHEAVAWTFGLSADDYHPILET